jgi:pimeloyl-ACP methyl ester carboxylesterase
MQTGFLPLDGGKLYYEVTGQGTPLVLVHSMWMNAALWDQQVAAFADEFLVIRYDMRGFGRSEMELKLYSDVEDLYTLLRHLKVDGAYVLGLSVGAEVAVGFTLAHPDMVKGLIAIGAGVDDYDKWSDTFNKAWADFMEAVKAGDHPKAIQHIIAMWVDGPIRSADERTRSRARELMQSYSFIHYQPTPEPTPSTEQKEAEPLREQLAALKNPVLVMVGDQDWPEMVEMADLLTLYIPGSKQVKIANAAHLIPLEQPDAFNHAVLDFLHDLEGR